MVLATKRLEAGGFCWPIYELAPALPTATEVLARIGALHRGEAEIRGRPADERCAIRQERSQPIIDVLEPSLREKLGFALLWQIAVEVAGRGQRFSVDIAAVMAG